VDDDVIEHRNEVTLVGKLSRPAELRTLPSGDEIATWRLVVRRATSPPRGGTTRGHDTVDCTAWTARLRRGALSWRPGDLVEVEGALRRRHWRGPSGVAASGYSVEVLRARRVMSSRRTP
jgi:single-strand DNA-binding protein